jgi:ABC-type branched-subunit amino acid transport system substrate-binding protein
MRVGVVYQAGGLGASTSEQVLGSRLAAEHTQSESPGPGGALEVVERPTGAEGPAFAAELSDLVNNEGCDALLGVLPVPLSIEAAKWAHAHGILYSTGNNNPLLWQGRKHVFHIGVPSEITASASMTYLSGERGAKRVAVLHTPGEFQVFAAECMIEAATKLGVDASAIDAGLDSSRDADVMRQIDAHRADAVIVMGSELDRVGGLVPQLAAGGRPTLLARGMVCREFLDSHGAEAEGFDFIDLFLRSGDAPDEERALIERVTGSDTQLVTTASHGFGWDCMRLLVAALSQGHKGTEGAMYLESLDAVPGATGALRFSATDHNGRWQADPTTFARLQGGRFVPIAAPTRS